jgi:Domain of unknown function (DUF4136)
MKHRLAALLTCVLIANATYAHKVTTTVNPTAPFGSYRTYAWMPGTPAPHPLAEQRIRASVVMELASKGLNAVDEFSDLYVATHMIAREDSRVVDNGFTLIVEIYDAHTRQLIWRAVASDTFRPKPSRNADRVDHALEEIFEKYPINPR